VRPPRRISTSIAQVRKQSAKHIRSTSTAGNSSHQTRSTRSTRQIRPILGTISQAGLMKQKMAVCGRQKPSGMAATRVHATHRAQYLLERCRGCPQALTLRLAGTGIGKQWTRPMRCHRSYRLPRVLCPRDDPLRRTHSESATPGRRSTQYFYEPERDCAIISPWNFPLAIRPRYGGSCDRNRKYGNFNRPTSPASSWNLVEIFREAGLPAGSIPIYPRQRLGDRRLYGRSP